MKENLELERDDIIIHPDLEWSAGEPDEITAYIESWFDVDKKFGTNTADDDTAWVNLYAVYNTATDTLVLKVITDRDTSSECEDYVPTEAEKKLIIALMEESCQAHFGKSLKDMCCQIKEESLDLGGME